MSLLILIIVYGFRVYQFAILAYVLMSWIPSLQTSWFGTMIGKIVEPYLGIFRRIIPPIGMIDISPIVAIFALQFIAQGVMVLLSYLPV